MKRIGTVAFAVIAVAGICAAPARGSTVLFDNFGPGDAYNAGVGWTVGDSNDWQVGPGFVLSAGGDYHLTSITASIRHILGANSVTLSVYETIGGVPGNLLETSSAADLPAHDGSPAPPTMFTFSGSTTLLDGGTYWVIASTDGVGGSWLSWNWSIDTTGLHGQRQGDGGAWQVFPNFEQAVMRVEGTLVPAPGVLGMLGLGLLGCRRRR